MKTTYNCFRVIEKSFSPLSITFSIALVSSFVLSGFVPYVSAQEVLVPVDQTPVVQESVPEAVVPVETPIVLDTSTEALVEAVLPEGGVEEGGITYTEDVVTPSDPAPATQVPAVVSTEHKDYSPGETATILGSFFLPFENLSLKVFGSDEYGQNYTESTQPITANEQGAFTAPYTLDSLFRPFYEIATYDMNGVERATGWFRDSTIGAYDQCSNNGGEGYTTGDTGCRWINGNLNGNNSTYHEGDATVQRLWLRGHEPGSTHTVTLQYGTTKGGHHAYDFLTQWNHSESWVNEVDLCQGITGCVGTSPVALAPIPQDPLAHNFDNFARNIEVRGATVASVGAPTLVNGTYAGDSETQVVVTFTVDDADTAGDMCTTDNRGRVSCDVALFFGAHVAQTSDWYPYDGTTGAGAISGSPYHVALASIDEGSVGQRDNQMAASALPPTLTIVKKTIGANGTFDFTATGGNGLPSNFSITTVNNTGTSTTYVLSKTGTYSVAETVPSGWSLTGATCSDGSPVSAIGIDANENVVCTFTNSPAQATLTLVKNVINNNGGTAQATDWTLSATGPTSISGTSGSQTVTQASVNTGAYTLAETGGPAGYTAGTWSCTAGVLNGAQLTLASGDNAVCTISNDDQPGTLIVKKIVQNGTTGATKTASDFSFSINGGGPITFESDGQNDNTVNAGTYTVTEPAVTGYTTSYSNCSNVTVPNGGSATCTITNTAIAPKLTLVKTVVNDNGGAATSADFQAKIDGNNVAWGSAIPLGVGAHTASEITMPTYTAGVWGGDCASDGSVTLALGDNKHCTITNNDNAPTLTLVKTVVNDNGGTAQATDWTLSATGPTSISGAGGVTSDATFDAGTYTLSESAGPAGYTAGLWTCTGTGTQNGAEITLALGQSATCTIINNDIAPTLTVIKHVINDSGDMAQASDFTMLVTGTNVSTPSFPGSETGVTVTLNAGAYSVDEANSKGYIKTLGENCSGTIALGESKTCTITNDDTVHATRSQGFWQTHTNYAKSVFQSLGSLTIGSHVIDSDAKLFGGFYASISKLSTGGKRTALDQARIQMLQQWLAAQLNCKAFGCDTATQNLLTASATAWTGNNIQLITYYTSQLDAYNNSNDALPIAGQGRATPKDSQSLAGTSLAWWNVLP